MFLFSGLFKLARIIFQWIENTMGFDGKMSGKGGAICFLITNTGNIELLSFPNISY